ncbi:unnamed protein product [Pieris macdunnoughi]|uniref:Uncharacterized protein n=1 Tax=Pieris macdunnoughi TaxID=345717 RepID=A0A821QXR8_9NEOP|nr:unnamed protein product [Pieris macdunnoughi]
MLLKLLIICIISQITLQWRMPIRANKTNFRTISYSVPKRTLGVTTKTRLYIVPTITNSKQNSLNQNNSTVMYEDEIPDISDKTDDEILDNIMDRTNGTSSEHFYDDSPVNDIVSENVMNTDIEKSNEDADA